MLSTKLRWDMAKQQKLLRQIQAMFLDYQRSWEERIEQEVERRVRKRLWLKDIVAVKREGKNESPVKERDEDRWKTFQLL